MSIVEQSGVGGVVSAGVLETAARASGSFTPREGGESLVIAHSAPRRVDLYKTLAVNAGDDELVIAHISRGSDGHGMTELQPKRAVYTACVHLREFSGYDVWCDERFSPGTLLPKGAIHINDMR